MLTAVTSEASMPMAAFLPMALRTAHVRHVRVGQPPLCQSFLLQSNRMRSQLRHLSGSTPGRSPGRATASEKPAPPKKEGRLSVLDRMGANRTTKIVIIVFLSIYGTMETLFYANAAYRYFSKENSE